MPRPTPATIKYAGNEQKEVERELTDEQFEDITAENIENDYLFDNNEQYLNTIRFHAVVSEDHKAQTQITKFPVQNGFEISNHAIKKNRIITLEGMVSNVILDNTEQAQYENTSNTINTVYKAMEALVQGAIPCTVETNLGVYDPVIFTRISTKQEAGLVDSIKVVLVGEEIQVAENIANTGPKELIFTAVPSSKRTAIINELETSGITVFEDSILSQAVAKAGESFSFTTALTSGELFNLEYIYEGWDGISEYTYSVVTGNTNVFSITGLVQDAIQQANNIPLIPSASDILGGLDNVTNCLLNNESSVIETEIEKYVDTAMGELRKVTEGAVQDTINIGKDRLMKSLIGTALDCVAVGLSDAVGSGNSENTDDIIDEILLGVKGLGDVATTTVAGAKTTISTTKDRVMTFIKIESPNRQPLDTRGTENASST